MITKTCTHILCRAPYTRTQLSYLQHVIATAGKYSEALVSPVPIAWHSGTGRQQAHFYLFIFFFFKFFIKVAHFSSAGFLVSPLRNRYNVLLIE